MSFNYIFWLYQNESTEKWQKVLCWVLAGMKFQAWETSDLDKCCLGFHLSKLIFGCFFLIYLFFSPKAVTFFAREKQQPQKNWQIWRSMAVFNSISYKFTKIILTWKLLDRLGYLTMVEMDNHEKCKDIIWKFIHSTQFIVLLICAKHCSKSLD